jgi:hypothetical protein
MLDPAAVDPAQPIAEIMKLGFAGAIIIAEFIIIVVIYRAKEQQAADRLTDMKSTLGTTTTALTKASESIDNSAESLKGVQGAVQNLANALERRR